MDRTLGIFSASTLLLALMTATMVSTGGSHVATSGVDGALLVANSFVTNEPTYKFDGIKESLKFDVTGTYPDPNQFEVTGDFTSAHGGYGDRNGKIVTQALTPHNCILIVENGQVSSAVMDGSYDMIAQKLVQ